MFTVTSASTRVSRRIATARASYRAASANRPARRSSLGETLAVGLGCDRW
jgi:hypothetical protein